MIYAHKYVYDLSNELIMIIILHIINFDDQTTMTACPSLYIYRIACLHGLKFDFLSEDN